METKQSKYQRHTHNSFKTTHAELRITEIKHTLSCYFVRHQMSDEDEYTPEVFNRRSE